MLENAKKDTQTVGRDGEIAGMRLISGVVVREGRNVLTRSGSLTEVFSLNWSETQVRPGHCNWVGMSPGAVTDWHCHAAQLDHIYAVLGTIRICLYDDRKTSDTRGMVNVFRVGALRPTLIIVPPGIWHGMHNEGGVPAGYINYFEKPFRHEDPDNFRLPHDTPSIPCRLAG
jgi:dTDP-4-dehydrorhamnose 3,5-epimerase